jgi:hypothetical protein
MEEIFREILKIKLKISIDNEIPKVGLETARIK